MDTNRGYLKYPLGPAGTGELRIAEASYRANGRGAQLRYLIVDSAAGQLLIAATEYGLSWLGVHESASYLESELRSDYPLAELRDGNDATDALAARILDHLRDNTTLEIPLDVRATPFQAAVWSELCAIPSGATRSYSEIARRIERPSASRAVGHANGSNPIAILIPCHRAIGADGSLTGYRWGLEYKRRLLAREGAKIGLEPSLTGQDPLPFG
jgi:AraC family transcriptional regulator of adaptative response/methylated-DNA-[protein]-cysteine methyltransferase